MQEIVQSEHPNSQHILPESIKQNAISDLIKKVGGFGLYQKVSLALFYVGACVAGQYTTITPFLFYQDQYQCNTIPQGFASCLDYVCSLSLDERKWYLPAPSMHTLANKFGDYHCSDSSSIINTLILIMFAGMIVAYLFMSIFGDYFGRKTFIIAGLPISIIGILMAILVKNIYLASVGLLIGSFGTQIIFNICFTIISQIVVEEKRESCLVVFQVFYSLGQLTDTGFYFWLRDW